MNERTASRHLRRMRPRLSAWRDGDLGALRAALVRRHVARCPVCQAEVRALDDAVASLALLKQAPPGADAGEGHEAGWQALCRALDADPQPMPMPAPEPRRWRWQRNLPRPALVLGGAMAAAAVAVVAIVWARPALQRRQVDEDQMITLAEEQFRRAELSYQRAADDLRAITARRQTDWSPERARGHEEGLRALELELARRRAEARARPADALAQQRLYLAYRREIAYLQDSLRAPVSLAAYQAVGEDDLYGFEGGAAP
jgi:hypothetical protein